MRSSASPSVVQPSGQAFGISPREPVYVIGVVSRLVQLPVWTLRILDREGLVKPKRRQGRARLYSLHDVRQLVQIRHWLVRERVNVRGIRVILRMTTSRAVHR